MDSYDERLRQLSDAALVRMLTRDRGDYTAAALDRAAHEADRRGLDVTRPVPESELVRCPSCDRDVEPVEQRVLLPTSTAAGVAAFLARSCTACGRTTFWLADL